MAIMIICVPFNLWLKPMEIEPVVDYLPILAKLRSSCYPKKQIKKKNIQPTPGLVVRIMSPRVAPGVIVV